MKNLKTFEIFNIMDLSGSMSDFGTRRTSKIEIWEVDNRKYTDEKMSISFNEFILLKRAKLINMRLSSNGADNDDYTYLKEDSEKIKNILELERNINKFNL